jgi:SAM-dependent methyltransferase
MNCRHCKKKLQHVFLDLGAAPPSNDYLSAEDLQKPARMFPLKLFVCDECWLVQTEDYAAADDLFRPDYAYFSSVSSGWLKHAANYAGMITKRLALDAQSFVVELASNDGYLLRNFVAAGIPCLGVEPTDATADAAEKLGIPVLRAFFGEALGNRLAADGKAADLIIGNNVYAHVPDINDFTKGMKKLLKSGGTITLEFPHLMQLIAQNQFDTVYHEHYSYLSLQTVARIFAAAGLRVCDVETLPTHGGSLRVYGCHADDPRADSPAVAAMLQQEKDFGLQKLETYTSFQPKADKVRDDLRAFLKEQIAAGKTVAAYGAAAKGNTLLNYAGVTADMIPFVCDAAPSKQGKFMPGSRIPILPPAAMAEKKPDWVLILPWNIAPEVVAQQKDITNWGGKFIVAVPKMEVLS